MLVVDGGTGRDGRLLEIPVISIRIPVVNCLSGVATLFPLFCVFEAIGRVCGGIEVVDIFDAQRWGRVSLFNSGSGAEDHNIYSNAV